jgi:hypothetical protein
MILHAVFLNVSEIFQDLYRTLVNRKGSWKGENLARHLLEILKLRAEILVYRSVY